MSNREFKVTCYITKKSCTDEGKPTKKIKFLSASHFSTISLPGKAMRPTLWALY